MTDIKENVARARDRIAAACARVGRSPGEVTIVGVTKTFGADRVEALIRAGVRDIGENRIQEFMEKAPEVTLECSWHFIGTLQRNKAPKAIGRFALIHSVDRARLAATLNRLGEENEVTTPVLVEVNTSGESSKHGAQPDAVIDLAGAIVDMPRLDLRGLMTIGPLTDDADAVRRAFQRLWRLREKLVGGLGRPLEHLSMGMSADFETAVEEGATIVRLGSVLLGARGR